MLRYLQNGALFLLQFGWIVFQNFSLRDFRSLIWNKISCPNHQFGLRKFFCIDFLKNP